MFVLGKFFCVEIMKFIMYVGCNVNVINSKGNSFFYLVVIFKFNIKDFLFLRDVLEILFDGGIYEDLVNSEGKIVMDIV